MSIFIRNIINTTICRSLVGLFFLILGYYIFEYINKINISMIKLILLSFINLILSLYNGLVDLWILKFNNIILYIFCSIIGSISIILLSKKFIKYNFLKFIGRNSLIIMGTHGSIIKIIDIIGIRMSDYIIGIIVLIFIMIIEIPIIKVINKYFPFIIGRFNYNNELIENKS